jgi:hypothetical protein
MIDFIASKTKEIMYNCCEKYAAKNKLSLDNVQLNLAFKFVEAEDGLQVADTYFMCQDYQKKEEYDIMKVLNVTIDFLGYSNLAPPFIVKSLLRYSEKYNILLENISIMCVPSNYVNEKGKTKKEVNLYLYNGNDYVPTTYEDEQGNEEQGIGFADLFRAEDFEMPTS